VNLIAVSQRVDIVAEYDERRDSLDQAWLRFLDSCNVRPVLVPNDPEGAVSFVEEVNVSGVLLTGGNNLISCGGDAPERDETEIQLLDWARKRDKPVAGVCRGMQLIQQSLGVRLAKVSGHVDVLHDISIQAGTRVVNSFHSFGATETVSGLAVWARTKDGVIEAVRHQKEKILGVMWHPERENSFDRKDVELFKSFFGEGP